MPWQQIANSLLMEGARKRMNVAFIIRKCVTNSGNMVSKQIVQMDVMTPVSSFTQMGAEIL